MAKTKVIGLRYDSRFFQLEGQGRYYAPAQSKVLVCEGRHGSIAIEYRGRALRWQEIPAPARPRVPEAKPAFERATEPRVKRKVPPADHPWRQAVRREVEKRALRKAMVARRPSLTLPYAALRAKPTGKTGDAVGRARWELSLLAHPGTKFFQGKRKSAQKKKKGTHF